MSLHLTGCAKVREPGFSRSECLELARKISHEWLLLCDQDGNDVSPQETALIVAALRAHAGE
jgi:hypothetical protein